jgi:hypothetical protein
LHALVENIAKKNRSCFPIAVLLTTLLCSQIFGCEARAQSEALVSSEAKCVFSQSAGAACQVLTYLRAQVKKTLQKRTAIVFPLQFF